MGCESITGHLIAINRFPQQFSGTHLYSLVERDSVRVKGLSQEHNTVSRTRAQTWTARSGDERTNHETTMPPLFKDLTWCYKCEGNGVVFCTSTLLTHWHLELFAKIVFFLVLKLDHGQIGFSLVENALVTQQLAVLATRIAFKTFWPRHAQKSKLWPTALGFSTFEFFFPFLFTLGFSFCCCDWPSPGLAWG